MLRRPFESNLNSPVAVVDEAGSPRLPAMESLLQGIEHELGPGRA
jgi:hypothetical protein